MAAIAAGSGHALPPVTLVLGGARSGKSAFAESLVAGHRRGSVYLATAEIHDDEMAERVRLHRARRDTNGRDTNGRDANWRTVEAPLDLAAALVAETEQGAAVLVDCLTLWLSNLMHAGRDPEAETKALMKALGQVAGPVVFVANEVGLGIVPDNKLAREFRDHAGRTNQRVAAEADAVFFIAAGLPMKLK